MNKKQRNRKRTSEEKARAKKMAFEAAMIQGAKEDVHHGGAQPSWGTALTGRMKAESEESRLVSCPGCGYSRGRHSRSCARLSFA